MLLLALIIRVICHSILLPSYSADTILSFTCSCLFPFSSSIIQLHTAIIHFSLISCNIPFGKDKQSWWHSTALTHSHIWHTHTHTTSYFHTNTTPATKALNIQQSSMHTRERQNFIKSFSVNFIIYLFLIHDYKYTPFSSVPSPIPAYCKNLLDAPSSFPKEFSLQRTQ